MEEIRFVIDQYGVVHALMPDGTYRPVLVNVHGNAWYGHLSVDIPTIIQANKEEDKNENHLS